MKNYLSKRAQGIFPYVAGEQPKDKKYIKLNTNENPYPPSPKAQEAYKNVAFADLRLYPPLGMDKLKSAIAAAEGVSPEYVFCGNGSDEILAFCFSAFFDADGQGAAFADVTYSFYPVFCDFFDVPKVIVPLEEDFSQDLSKLQKTPAQGVVIANPNAPTGMGIPRGEMEKFVSESGRIVIVDEAYMPFYGQSAVPLTQKYDNLLVCKTFSKGYSLAGLRCGYAIGQPSLIGAVPLQRLLQFLPARPRLPGGVRRRHFGRRILRQKKCAGHFRARTAEQRTYPQGILCPALLLQLRVCEEGGNCGQRGIRTAARARRAGAPFPKTAHLRFLPHHRGQRAGKRRSSLRSGRFSALKNENKKGYACGLLHVIHKRIRLRFTASNNTKK